MNLNDNLKLFYDFFQDLQQNINNILNEERQNRLDIDYGKVSEWKSTKSVRVEDSEMTETAEELRSNLRRFVRQIISAPSKMNIWQLLLILVCLLTKNLMNKNNFIINTNQKIFTHMIT